MGGRFQKNGLPPGLLRRIAVYGACLLLLSVAQCSFFARLRFLPATPDLILGFAVAVTLLDSRKSGIAVAIAGGFWIDALGGVGVSLSPILYVAVAVLVSFPAQKMLPRFFSWLILMLPATLCDALYGALRLWLRMGAYPIREALLEILLPMIGCTLLFCAPLYGAVRLCLPLLQDPRERSLR